MRIGDTGNGRGEGRGESVGGEDSDKLTTISIEQSALKCNGNRANYETLYNQKTIQKVNPNALYNLLHIANLILSTP